MQTSYFNNLGLNGNLVSIAGKAHPNFKGREYKKLAPLYWFYKEYKIDNDYRKYTQRYYDLVLAKLNPQQVYEELGEDAILICWELYGYFCHRRLVAKWLYEELNITVNEILPSDTLECSSKGDKRFSAFYAKVTLPNNLIDSIENIYQLSKRFPNQLNIKEAKGKTPQFFTFLGVNYPVNLLTSFYEFLWLLYFIQHEYFVDYIKQYKNFTDMFRGKSVNCQADIVNRVRSYGLNNLIKENYFCNEYCINQSLNRYTLL